MEYIYLPNSIENTYYTDKLDLKNGVDIHKNEIKLSYNKNSRKKPKFFILLKILTGNFKANPKLLWQSLKGTKSIKGEA